MAGSSETAPVLQAKPGVVPADPIYQGLTGKSRSLTDVGLVKVVLVYMEKGVPVVMSNLVWPKTLDKLTNIIEDERVG